MAASHNPIAGFWRRLGAFVLDGLILGLIGMVIGTLLFNQLIELGPWGRGLGFLIACVYFGSFNSHIGGGQTFGKRLLKIKVVGRDGRSLSVLQALLRFMPLAIPWFLNNAQFPEYVVRSAWSCVLSVAIFGIGCSVIYLYCFNRRSRQSVQDLVVGSYVVVAGTDEPVGAVAVWPFHLTVCAVLMIAAAVIPYFTKQLVASEAFSSLSRVQEAVRAEPWIAYAQANMGQLWLTSSPQGELERRYLHVIAYSKDDDIKSSTRPKQLAELALSADPAAASLDVIQITLVYGYDIGIASFWQSRSLAHSPTEWRAL